MPYRDRTQQAEAARRWREQNRDVIRARYAMRYRDHALEQMRVSYAANPESKRRQAAEWYAANRDRAAAATAARYRRTRPERIAATAVWRAAHPLATAVYSANARARAAGAGRRLTVAEWRSVLVAADGRCTYCGEVRPLTLDHRTPFARGGSNEAANISAACLPCNGGKRDRTTEEWLAYLASSPVRRLSA